MSITAGTKRGPYAATRERRQGIASAVVALVDAGGIDAVTIAAVAERSGLSERTVIYHFPTKDHLLVAALELIDDLATPEIDESTEFDLASLRERSAETQLDGRRLQLFLVLKGCAAIPGHPAGEYFQRRTELLIGLYATLISHAQASGHAHAGLDARKTALQLASLWDGLTGLSIHDDSIDVAELLVQGFRLLTGANWVEAVASLNDPRRGL